MRFEGLRESLLTAGIAPRHVRRYLRELDDHLADLTQAQRAAGHNDEDAAARALALLGSEAELAAAMLAQPGFKSLPARAPWLVFGLLPPVAIACLFLATVVPLALIKKLYDVRTSGILMAPAPVWFQGLAHAVALFANFGLGPGLAALMVWMATRQRLGWKWPLLAASLIALLGAHMTAYFPEQGHSTLSVSSMNVSHMFRLKLTLNNQIRVNQPESWMEFLVQFFLTLAPGLWLVGHRRFARLMEPH
jgi:hypothetical protein